MFEKVGKSGFACGKFVVPRNFFSFAEHRARFQHILSISSFQTASCGTNKCRTHDMCLRRGELKSLSTKKMHFNWAHLTEHLRRHSLHQPCNLSEVNIFDKNDRSKSHANFRTALLCVTSKVTKAKTASLRETTLSFVRTCSPTQWCCQSTPTEISSTEVSH